MPKEITLRLLEAHRTRLSNHLFPGDGRESVALALCGGRYGGDRNIYCVHEVVEVPIEACVLRTNAAVRWNVERLIPVLENALIRRLCVMKIHSHPPGCVRFSPQDDATDIELVKSVEGILDRSSCLLSAFMLPDGEIHARIVDGSNGFAPIERLTVTGDQLDVFQPERPIELNELDLRTRQAFGDGTTNLLRRLSVGVVGCSGTGSWVVEMLARLGIGRLVLVDPDHVERKNLNRIPNSKMTDADQKRRKVEVLAEAVRLIGYGTMVQTYASDLTARAAVQALAGCDFLFGCMDSADGRDLLNRISTYYLLPYIDVGVRLDADGNGGIEQICCAVHYLIPGGSSLLSRGVITAEQVQAQAMYRTNPEQHASLEKEGYIKGVAVDRPAVVSVNGFAASHAVNEMLARLHPFRRDANEEFRHQVFSLCDGGWHRIADGPVCPFLTKYVGRGDAEPLLGSPALS